MTDQIEQERCGAHGNDAGSCAPCFESALEKLAEAGITVRPEGDAIRS